VYFAKRRRIFLVDDEMLGRVAIKEMRYEGAMRRLRYGYLRYGDAMREFRVGSAFEALGGQTPGFLAAAVERNVFGLRRVLLFIRWLDGVETLTDYFARLDSLGSDVFSRLADALIAAARLGLVHGRHSSENILVDTRGAAPSFYVIDFAYARLGQGFDADGFVRDLARIVHWLWHKQILDPTQTDSLFECVTHRAFATASERTARVSQMNEELRRWQVSLDKVRDTDN
jgi:RIO-like serine/threonine protein kinase